MNAQTTSRVDLHCHSTASQEAKLGVQRSLGLPECATPPGEVYALAKRRGMDFVTITDHDTIDGALAIADRPDVFVSEELTVRFKGEPQAVHVLCWGITPGDHEWLQAHNGDVETCAAYLQEHGIASALAHPFFAVAAPLLPRHRRRLAELFPIWETRNGSRARELNQPAAVYIETHGGTGVGGSDDHAGVDIGRTFTETPPAATPEELLAHLRAGSARPRGEEGSPAKWAHAAMAIATRVLGDEKGAEPNPLAVFGLVERVVREADTRGGAIGADLGPDDARGLLEAWLRSVGVEARGRAFLEELQADGFSHADLYRRARRAHERALKGAVSGGLDAVAGGADLGALVAGLFAACLPAVPYAPAAAFQGRETSRLRGRGEAPLRVALVADGVGEMHGVTRTIEEIRDRGVRGFDVEIVGTDPNVDRRLSAVADVELPFSDGLRIGVPSVPALVETLAEGNYDLVHLCSPGPCGLGAGLIARIMDLPVAGSYHTELAAYAGLRSGDQGLEAAATAALGAFYGQCDAVLSPSPSADASVTAMGIAPERVLRWDRGVDLGRFSPRHRAAASHPGRVKVLYAGRMTKEKGVDLLAESFLLAAQRDPRLHLVLAGGGPEEASLRAHLGDRATFLGWLEGEDLARAYANADMFLFASRTDTYGQVILEAQASGLPVVAVAEGGPTALIEDGRSGLLCPPDPEVLSQVVLRLASAPSLRARLALGGLDAVWERSWERSLARLADGWRAALDRHARAREAVAA